MTPSLFYNNGRLMLSCDAVPQGTTAGTFQQMGNTTIDLGHFIQEIVRGAVADALKENHATLHTPDE